MMDVKSRIGLARVLRSPIRPAQFPEATTLATMDELAATRRATELLTSLSTAPPPGFRAWDGSEWGPDDAPFTLVLTHPGALRSALLPPNDLSAGEAYVFGDMDIEGDIFAAMRFGAEMQSVGFSFTTLRLLRLLRKLPDRKAHADERPRRRPTLTGRLHSIGRDRDAVTYHYDTSNAFFRTFLDPAMVYSCGYFLSPDDTLEDAQTRKLDVVCRKLGLEPGDRFLDVGCGWGALVVHAVTHYGVEATGVTLSRPQAEEARRRIELAGIEDRARILEIDYREIEGEFDAVASVGMVEHVGKPRLGEYFDRLRSVLAPGGALLNHGIVTNDRGRPSRRPSFIRTYVFPDARLTSIDDVASAAQDAGFEIRDVEALRMSYALTLRHWVANLEARRDEAVAAAGERVYRIWRAYMAGSAVAFEDAAIGVHQMLLTDPARPWTHGRSGLLADDDVRTSGERPPV